MALLTQAVRERCRLLELPAELLNRIYIEVLAHNSVLEIYPSGDPVEFIDEWEKTDRAWAHFRPSEPSLTRTCHEIRNDTLPIFYGLNIFQDTNYDPCCTRFFKWLTPKKRLMLREVRIQRWLKDIFEDDRATLGICVHKSQRKLARMKKWLEKNEIELPEGVIHVPVRLHDDEAGDWTSDPQGLCKLGGCCGNEMSLSLKIIAPSEPE